VGPALDQPTGETAKGLKPVTFITSVTNSITASGPRAVMMRPRSRTYASCQPHVDQQRAHRRLGLRLVARQVHRERSRQQRRGAHHRRKHGVERLDDARFRQRGLEAFGEAVGGLEQAARRTPLGAAARVGDVD